MVPVPTRIHTVIAAATIRPMISHTHHGTCFSGGAGAGGGGGATYTRMGGGGGGACTTIGSPQRTQLTAAIGFGSAQCGQATEAVIARPVVPGRRRKESSPRPPDS